MLFRSLSFGRKVNDESSHFSFQDFLSYMFSIENDILDPETLEMNLDHAHEPLAHYFINSSHNTFLTGKLNLLDCWPHH